MKKLKYIRTNGKALHYLEGTIVLEDLIPPVVITYTKSGDIMAECTPRHNVDIINQHTKNEHTQHVYFKDHHGHEATLELCWEV